MASPAMRSTAKTARRLLLVAALAASSTGLSQALESRIVEELESELQAIELREGPSSRELIGPLTALAMRHEENGDHVIAGLAGQRALHLVRMHDGLYSLDQAPLLRGLIRSTGAIGNHEEAWNLEQELLTLAMRHPDDLRTARILRDTADRRMDILNRYVAGEWPPEIVIGCYYSETNSITRERTGCTSGSRRTVRRKLAGEAQEFYAEAVNIILRNQEYGDSELASLLEELVHSSYRFGNPALGERSLRYLLAYQATNSEPWLVRIDTLTRLADWELLYSQSRGANESALRAYEQAYELLLDQEAAQSFIERTFSPDIPVVLPAFVPNPLITEQRSATRGHIDIAFDIGNDGKSEEVEILDTTTNSTRADERQLIQLILRSRFRPRVTSGRFADTSRVSVRYYLND